MSPGRKRNYGRIDRPIWTENKAKFIQKYLSYFVQITHHGTYIDGFAGPQRFDGLDAWCAALVMNGKPMWLRHFYLCEISRKGIKAIRKLVNELPIPTDKKNRKLTRHVEIFPGDFNRSVDKILDLRKISPKEATFCLLDQRTFECEWSTLQKLASYKLPPNNKIELLYFLGVGWLHRAFSGIRNNEKMVRWWGSPHWRHLTKMASYDIAEEVRRRFNLELKYKHVAAYPIFESKENNKVMYYMIHASDHEEAPALMVRAHRSAVRAIERSAQIPLSFIDRTEESA
jgi:three-Cys-motif partner protein